MSLPAFGGGELVGDRLVRIAYLDETGHSAKEPVAIVAGVILDPDKQWRLLAERLKELVATDVPEQFRKDFVFHANDLLNGGKYRQEWPDEARWATLDKLVALPRELKIPVCLGLARKPVPRDDNRHRESIISHIIAYALCIASADFYMRNEAPPDEVAMVVAENRKEAREYIEQAHQELMSEEGVKGWMPDTMMRDLPISRVKAPPAFASKQVEPLLQIADACAFVLQRHVNAAWQSDRLIQAMFGSVSQPAILSTLRTVPGHYGGFSWQHPHAPMLLMGSRTSGEVSGGQPG